MADVTLIRHRHEPFGVFGVIFMDDMRPLVTCEQPWRGFTGYGNIRHPYGIPYQSCVPVGAYKLIWRESPKFGWSWFLSGEGVNITNQRDGTRFACLIHPANWPKQLQGCIAIGKTTQMVGGDYGITDSRWAVGEFESNLDHSTSHKLLICNG